MRRLSTAFHEAGHAIVGLALGHRVIEVSIVASQGVGYSLAGHTIFERYHLKEHARSVIIRMAAGQAAQALHDESSVTAFGISGDEEQIAAIAEYLPCAADERLREIERCRRDARNIALDHWPDIEALAEALMMRGTIAGSTIAAAITAGRRDLDEVLELDMPFGRRANAEGRLMASVSIRLGVTGEADLKRTFDDVAKAGQTAFDGIGKSMDQAGQSSDRQLAHFQRLAQAARDAESAGRSQSSLARPIFLQWRTR